MTYASGNLIQATDYNNLGWTGAAVGNQMGVGTGNHGLGQSTSAYATVAAGNTVTAAQWSGLISGINNCLAHEGQTTITPASVAAGNTITYYSAIATGTAAAYNNSGTTGLALSAGTTNTTSYATGWGTTGNRGLKFTQSFTFTDGNYARYFFNAGGKIRLSWNRTGGSATTRNTDWTALLTTAAGTVDIGWNNTTKNGGGTVPTTIKNTNNGGYWNLTGAEVTHFQQYDNSNGYSGDWLASNVYWSGTAANGGSPTINIITYMVNAYVNSWQDGVDGTTSASATVYAPATTYLTNTWGTPTFSGSVALY